MKLLSHTNLKENERLALDDIKRYLSKTYPGCRLILYGSKARGDSGQQSDIDLLIILNKQVDSKLERAIIHFAYDLELKYDVVLGLMIESKNNWRSQLAKAMPIHWNIDREGVAL